MLLVPNGPKQSKGLEEWQVGTVQWAVQILIVGGSREPHCKNYVRAFPDGNWVPQDKAKLYVFGIERDQPPIPVYPFPMRFGHYESSIDNRKIEGWCGKTPHKRSKPLLFTWNQNYKITIIIFTTMGLLQWGLAGSSFFSVLISVDHNCKKIINKKIHIKCECW